MLKVVAAAAVLLGAVAVLVVPFHPEAGLLAIVDSVTPATRAMRRLDWFVVESGGNFVMFALVGVAFWALLRRPVIAFICGCALSAAAELVQLLIPSRVASWSDLVTNCLGAGAGVATAVVVARVVFSRNRTSGERSAQSSTTAHD